MNSSPVKIAAVLLCAGSTLAAAANGREVPSGIYLIRLTTPQGSSTVRALKVR